MLDILQLFITSSKPLYFLIFFLLGSQCCRAYSNKPRRLVSWLTLLYLCYSCWYIGYIWFQFWINTGKLLQCFDQNILFHWGVDHFLQILVIYKFIFVYLYLEFMLLNVVNCFSPDWVCRRSGWCSCPFHGWIYYWWHLGEILEKYAFLTCHPTVCISTNTQNEYGNWHIMSRSWWQGWSWWAHCSDWNWQGNPWKIVSDSEECILVVSETGYD